MFPIRDRLNDLADRIERTLAQYGAPASVTGGTVGPRIVSFVVTPQAGIRAAAIRRLADELAMAIGTEDLSVRRTRDGLVVEFARDDPRVVGFTDLLSEARPLPPSTALLGVTSAGLPLLARLPSPEVSHVLIAGTTGSGKSVLLRTIAASLVLAHAPEAVRLALIDVKALLFGVFDDLPHLLRPTLADPSEISEVLRSLVKLMDIRDRRREPGVSPTIVVCIDELADVIMSVEGVTEPLTRLLQRGRESGIHVIAATQRPSAAILSGLMRANFPLRLVGRVVTTDDARIAAGRGGTGAHTLLGRGDFLAVTGSQIYRFQAACATWEDLNAAFVPLRSGTGDGHELLPVTDRVPDDDAEDATDVEVLARRLTPWWDANGGEWGSKTAACHFLFGKGVRYAGYYARLTDEVINRVTSIATSTTRDAHPVFG